MASWTFEGSEKKYCFNLFEFKNIYKANFGFWGNLEAILRFDDRERINHNPELNIPLIEHLIYWSGKGMSEEELTNYAMKFMARIDSYEERSAEYAHDILQDLDDELWDRINMIPLEVDISC